MGLRFVLAWAGRHSPEPWESLCADYLRRIAPWVPIQEKVVKAGARGDDATRRRHEAEALRRATPAGALRVALDERGVQWTSERLAQEVERWRAEWPHPVVFYLGSDLGLEPEFLAECRLRLSLGRMTLPHHLARLVLLEQLYRALSIVAGINYHRPTL